MTSPDKEGMRDPREALRTYQRLSRIKRTASVLIKNHFRLEGAKGPSASYLACSRTTEHEVAGFAPWW